MEPEDQALLISFGIVLIGNAIKPKNRDVGNFTQGIGIGVGAGTILHLIDQKYPTSFPHHDITALVSIPITYVLDKTNIIKNKDLANNLYGMGLGMLSQHLLTEGCSICGTVYCKPEDKLC